MSLRNNDDDCDYYDNCYFHDDCGCDYHYDPHEHCGYNDSQTHVHEFLGSTKLAEYGYDRHNHRFAGVTSEAIPDKKSHKHTFMVNSDFFDHHHEVSGETGPAIFVGNGKHVHYAEGQTTIDNEHFHDFQFASLIEGPLLPNRYCKK